MRSIDIMNKVREVVREKDLADDVDFEPSAEGLVLWVVVGNEMQEFETITSEEQLYALLTRISGKENSDAS